MGRACARAVCYTGTGAIRQILASSPPERALDLLHREPEERGPAVGTRGRIRRREEVVQEPLHPLARQRMIHLDRRVARGGRHEAAAKLADTGERRAHAGRVAEQGPQENRGCARSGERRNRVDPRRTVAEGLNLEAEPAELGSLLLEEDALARIEVHQDREQELLDRHLPRFGRGEMALEQDALVRRVLVHDEKTVGSARDDVRVLVLAEGGGVRRGLREREAWRSL